ncbi:MAG: copper-binding protein [Oxalobacteraceae bacterium]
MNRHTLSRTIGQQLISALVITCSVMYSCLPAWADHHEGGHGAANAQAAEKVNAEIRKIDSENGKITLKHEALTQFNMGAMTMVFRVEDTAVLTSFSVGDKVRFVPVKKNGQFVAHAMEKAD